LPFSSVVRTETFTSVFTRDIGFVIGNCLYEGRMHSHRLEEQKEFSKWVQEHGLKHIVIKEHIEGGDVLIDLPYVWIGHSGRTSYAGIMALQKTLEQQHLDVIVHILKFPARYLHLDCLFTITNKQEALLFSPAFLETDIDKIYQHYQCIEVNEVEQQQLATNVLNIGHRTLLASGQNTRVNRLLVQNGYMVKELMVDEFIARHGGPRCLSLPLCRQE